MAKATDNLREQLDPYPDQRLNRVTTPLIPRAMLAQWMYWSRGIRPNADQSGLYSDPAWDILLDLYIQQAAGKLPSVTSACIGSRSPPTTALRWLAMLEKSDLLTRVDDADDRRRSILSLSDKARAMMDDYFDQIIQRLSKMIADVKNSSDIQNVKELTSVVERLIRVLTPTTFDENHAASVSAFFEETARKDLFERTTCEDLEDKTT